MILPLQGIGDGAKSEYGHDIFEIHYRLLISRALVKLETMEQAQSAPTPATIFSLFYYGKFVTADISACMDNRFDKTVRTKKNELTLPTHSNKPNNYQLN